MPRYKYKYKFELYSYGQMFLTKEFTKDEYNEALKFFNKNFSNNEIGIKVYKYGRLLKFKEIRKEFPHESTCRIIFD